MLESEFARRLAVHGACLSDVWRGVRLDTRTNVLNRENDEVVRCVSSSSSRRHTADSVDTPHQRM